MNAKPHGMSCPIDGAQLSMSERQGIEIDYCPTCRGVWLDRGELDKIVERSAAETDSRQRAPGPAAYSSGGHHSYGDKRRPKSFLDELFD